MYIETLTLANFGPFKQFDLKPNPQGINLITGHNGSGKTQLAGAIGLAVAGEQAIQFNPDGDCPALVELTLRELDVIQTITYKVSKNDSDTPSRPLIVRSSNQISGSSATTQLDRLLLLGLIDISGPSLYLQSYDTQIELSKQDINVIMKSVPSNTDLNSILQKMWDVYEKSGYQPQMLSGGEQFFLKLVQEVVRRLSSTFSMPLIIDTVLGFCNPEIQKIALELLQVLAQRDQIIILELPDYATYADHPYIKTTLALNTQPRSVESCVSYNYHLQNIFDVFKSTRPTNNFVLGLPVKLEENRHFEFKEVKTKTNPVSSIEDSIDQYVVAFLNSVDPKPGRIYWGITDEDKEVVGVRLNMRERDKIRRVVTERLFRIEPPIPPTSIQIDFHRIYDINGPVEDLYVIEIVIPPSTSTYLYSTGKGEVYVKTDAGKKKLSILQIQEELLKRHRYL